MLNYLLLRFMVVLVGLMPFRVMYVFSDAMYFLVYYVIGYRRNVVSSNLSNAFPEKSADEIRFQTQKFYRHLCDISLESIKGFGMTRKELVRRHRVLNPELADNHFNKGVSVIAVPGHYNNWEWGSMSPGLQIKYPIVVLYKRMNNKRVETFIRKHRAKYNTRLASLHETSSTFNELSDVPHVFIMAADQSPTNLDECYWIDFLNHDTPWLHGPEKYARKYNCPVIYVDIHKVNRGFYELKLVQLTDAPASLPNGEITRLYAQHLEKSIIHEPAFWLWSHRRWKHTR